MESHRHINYVESSQAVSPRYRGLSKSETAGGRAEKCEPVSHFGLIYLLCGLFAMLVENFFRCRDAFQAADF